MEHAGPTCSLLEPHSCGLSRKSRAQFFAGAAGIRATPPVLRGPGREGGVPRPQQGLCSVHCPLWAASQPPGLGHLGSRLLDVPLELASGALLEARGFSLRRCPGQVYPQLYFQCFFTCSHWITWQLIKKDPYLGPTPRYSDVRRGQGEAWASGIFKALQVVLSAKLRNTS